MKRRTGILLVNLGTPDSPKPRDVKRYLSQFLTDRRVIDLPWAFRQLLVRGVIVRKRYRSSAKLYSSIWTNQGSPLKVYGEEVAKKLGESLGEKFHVELAMRYQNPSIERALLKLKGARRLLIIPLFPQYASATTGSIYQEVFRLLQKWEVIPSLTCLDQFATHKDVIRAFCASAKKYDFSEFDHILFSYHGLPVSHIQKADDCGHCYASSSCCETLTDKNESCYAAQCVATTKAICKELGLSKSRISHSYQSRLGKDPWIKPYTAETLKNLAYEGKKRVLVFCPAFVADCLETLEEIGVEYRSDFKNWGGEKLDFVEGLNGNPEWIEALKKMVLEQLPSEVKCQFL